MNIPTKKGFYWYVEDDSKLEVVEVVVTDGVVNYYLPGEDFTYKEKDFKGNFICSIEMPKQDLLNKYSV